VEEAAVWLLVPAAFEDCCFCKPRFRPAARSRSHWALPFLRLEVRLRRVIILSCSDISEERSAEDAEIPGPDDRKSKNRIQYQ